MAETGILKSAIPPLKITNLPAAGPSLNAPAAVNPPAPSLPSASPAKQQSPAVQAPAPAPAPAAPAAPVAPQAAAVNIQVPKSVQDAKKNIENIKKKLMGSRLVNFAPGSKSSKSANFSEKTKKFASPGSAAPSVPNNNSLDHNVDSLMSASSQVMRRIMRDPTHIGETARKAFNSDKFDENLSIAFGSALAKFNKDIAEGRGGLGAYLHEAGKMFEAKPVNSAGNVVSNIVDFNRNITIGDTARSYLSAASLSDEMRNVDDNVALLQLSAAALNPELNKIFDSALGRQTDLNNVSGQAAELLEQIKLNDVYKKDLQARLGVEALWGGAQTALTILPFTRGAKNFSALRAASNALQSSRPSGGAAAKLLSGLRNAATRGGAVKTVTPAISSADEAAKAVASAVSSEANNVTQGAVHSILGRAAEISRRAVAKIKKAPGAALTAVKKAPGAALAAIKKAPGAAWEAIKNSPRNIAETLKNPSFYESAILYGNFEPHIRNFSLSAINSETPWDHSEIKRAPVMADAYQTFAHSDPDSMRALLFELLSSNLQLNAGDINKVIDMSSAHERPSAADTGVSVGLGLLANAMPTMQNLNRELFAFPVVMGGLAGYGASRMPASINWQKLTQAPLFSGVDPKDAQAVQEVIQYINSMSENQLRKTFTDMYRANYLQNIIKHNPSMFSVLSRASQQP